MRQCHIELHNLIIPEHFELVNYYKATKLLASTDPWNTIIVTIFKFSKLMHNIPS
jgi:hypothetical protein